MLPVRQIVATARGIIQTGRLDARVSMPASKDELDELVRLFNTMLAIALVSIPSYVRLVRASAMSELAKDYVIASYIDDTYHIATPESAFQINAIYEKWFQKPVPPKGINLNLPMSPQLKAAFANPTSSGDPAVYK